MTEKFDHLDSVPEVSAYPGPSDRDITYEDIEATEQIGTGGFATASLASVDGTDLVVKEPITDGTKTVETVERFIAEAETWAQVDGHEHIVGVADWGRRLPWIALEYMDGGTLRERLDRAAMETREALWIGICLSRAIQHAHRHGIVHLDLTPNNVLFRATESGTWDIPKIGDWGLSKMLVEQGTTVGGLTPNYAAPEQFDPDVYGNPDDFTDRFHLGAVVYEALTGEQAFQGSAAAVMRNVLDGDVTPPTEIEPSLPGRVDDIFDRALAAEKADRYETVVNFRRDLSEILETMTREQRATGSVTTEVSQREDAKSTSRTEVAENEETSAETDETDARPSGLYDTASDLGVDRTVIDGVLGLAEGGTTGRRQRDPLRLAVDRTFGLNGKTHVVARVLSGRLEPDTRLEFSPSGVVTTVESLERTGSGETIPAATPGDSVSIITPEAGQSDEIRHGDIGGKADDTPPRQFETADVFLYVVDHPSVITAGYTPVVHSHASKTACTVEEIRSTTEVLESGTWSTNRSPDFAEPGEVAEAKIAPQRPLTFDTVDAVPETGWFTVRDQGQVVAVGVVTDVHPPSVTTPTAGTETVRVVDRLPDRPPGVDEEIADVEPLTAGLADQPVPVPRDAPLRIPISDVYDVSDIGSVATGTVQTGLLDLDAAVAFQPSGVDGRVDTIERNHEERTSAEPGDTIAFHVEGVAKDDIRRGDVCGPARDSPSNPGRIRARLLVTDHPSVITPSYTAVVHAHTAQVACTVERIEAEIDAETGDVLEENPVFVQSGDVAEIVLDPQKALSVEPVTDVPELGVFAVRDMGQTIGVGVVLESVPS